MVMSVFDELDVQIELHEEHTLWRIVSCGKFSFAFYFIKPLRDMNTHYWFYVIVFGINLFVSVCSNVTRSIYFSMAVDTFHIITAIIFVLECNVDIFKQTLKTFDMYYKTINIFIAVIAYNINCEFERESYDADITLLRSFGILSVAKNTLLIFCVSALDGYNTDKIIKATALIMYSIYIFIYFYIFDYFIYADQSNVNAEGNLFGYKFHWHTISSSCMSNAMIFLQLQLYRVIRKPSKLVFVPTLIKFEFTKVERISTVVKSINDMDSIKDTVSITDTHDTNDDHSRNIEYDHDNKHWCMCNIGNGDVDADDQTLTAPYVFRIDRNDTLYKLFCTHIGSSNVCDAQCIENCRKCLYSKVMFWFMLIYNGVWLTWYYIKDYYKINGLVQISLFSIQLIIVTIVLLYSNRQVFKLTATTMVFWWKLLDVWRMYFCLEIINFTNEISIWNLQYVQSLSQCYIIAFLKFAVVTTASLYVVSINSSVVTMKSQKYACILSSISIIMALMFAMGITLKYFIVSDLDYVFIYHNWSISLRTILIAKGIDLSVFVSSQLYTNAKFGSKGVQVIGHVNKNWKKMKNYREYIDNNNQNNVVELIAQH